MIFKTITKFKIYLTIAVIWGNLQVNSLPPTLKIGAIFSETQRHGATELAFKYAVYSINRDKGLLPETNLLYDIQYTNELDSFHACEKVCNQISYGVQAIFGPSNSLISSYVHSICDALDLPHLEAHIDTDNEVGSREEFAINLHPYQTYINDAFMDAMNYLNWTKVGILHEKYYGRIQLRRLIRIPMEVHIRHVDPRNYLSILNEMKDKEIHNLIIDTNSENIQVLLKGITEVSRCIREKYVDPQSNVDQFDWSKMKVE